MAVSEATDVDAPSAPAPPGLHEATDENRECGNCTYFRSSGTCTKFPPLVVSDEWLCGAWKAGGKDIEDESPSAKPSGAPARTVRQAQRGALARINEINARNRSQPVGQGIGNSEKEDR